MAFLKRVLFNTKPDPSQPQTFPRFPAAYTPASGTIVNRAAIRRGHTTSGLNYREGLSAADFERVTSLIIRIGLVLTLLPSLLAISVTLSGRSSDVLKMLWSGQTASGPTLLLPRPEAEYAALFIGVIAVFIAIRSPMLGIRPGSLILWALAAPVLLYALRYVSALMLTLGLQAKWMFFGLMIALPVLAYGPARFFYQWMTATPLGRTRLDGFRQKFALLRPLLLTYGVMLVIPFLFGKALYALKGLDEPGYEGAVLIAVGLGLFLQAFQSYRRKSASAIAKVLTPYLIYTGSRHGAAGTWVPRGPSERARRVRVFFLFAVPTLALIYGVMAFLPPINAAFVRSYLTPPDVPLATNSELVDSASRTYLAPVLSLIWTVLAPLPFGIVLVTFVSMPFVILALHYSEIEEMSSHATADEPDQIERPLYVDRLKNSPDPLERQHLFLGVEPELQFPVLLHKPLLNEHCYIVGDSGSGKTSLGIMPLLQQLLPDKPPLVVLDLKGDMAMFEMIREIATQQGQRFLFFTPERGRASCFFNPFQSFKSENRTVLQLCQLFLDALSLNHGEGYGRSYFSRRARSLLFEAMTLSEEPLETFSELYERLKELAAIDPITQKDTFELVSTIQALTQYPQLLTDARVRPDPRYTIHMPTLIEEHQIAYFWLPSAIESMTAREIGKLALFALLTAAIDRQRDQAPGSPTAQTYLVIDEFQRLAGDNFKIVLEQARTFGLAAILANQSFNDLQTPAGDLRSTVQTNTRVKMYFSVNDLETADYLSKISGEDIAVQRSIGFSRTQTFAPESFVAISGQGTSDRYAPALRPRLSVSDVRRYSEAANMFLLHVSRGSGYTQFYGHPIPVATEWPVTKQQYDTWRNAAWPTIQGSQKFEPVESELRTQDEVELLSVSPAVSIAASPQDIDEAARRRAARHRSALRQLLTRNDPRRA